MTARFHLLVGAVLGVLLLFVHYTYMDVAWYVALNHLYQSISTPSPLGAAMIGPMVRERLWISLVGGLLGATTVYAWQQHEQRPSLASSYSLVGGLLALLLILLRSQGLMDAALDINSRFTPRAFMVFMVLRFCDASLIWALLLLRWGYRARKQTNQDPERVKH